MFPIIEFPNKTNSNLVQYKNRDTAKKLPVLFMGLIGFVGILVSLVINEPQFNLQAQCAGLVSPNQVVHLMLQLALF
ncbi:MAG: hypothetical protein COA86_15385 [Kangiella sp.]|nr:MAG: hypothetical protein COA86_15385 [Kangiella sp.]